MLTRGDVGAIPDASLALKALTAFLQQKNSGTARREALDIIVDSWEDELWPWIECIRRRALNVKTPLVGFPDDARREYMDNIVEALYYYRFYEPLFKKVKDTDGLAPLLISLWYLEAVDPELDPYALVDNPPDYENDLDMRFPPDFLSSSLLQNYLLFYTVEIDPLWAPDFLKVCDGDPLRVGEVTMIHLRRSIKYLPEGSEYLKRLYDDIHVLGVLSDYDPFENALVAHNGPIWATKALIEVVKLEMPKKFDEVQAIHRCVMCIIFYLHPSLDGTDGILWTMRAVEAGLIPALLRCDRFMEGIGESEAPLMLFQKHLPKELIFVTVARALASSFKVHASEISMLEGKMNKRASLWRGWIEFKEVAKERLSLFGSIVNSAAACSNKKCSKKNTTLTFKPCEGCYVLSYCSDACQKISWEDGHKSHCQCKQWEQRRLNGQSAPFPDSHIKHSIKVFNHDRRTRADLILSSWKRDLARNTSPSPGRPVLVLDYNTYPPQLSTGFTSTYKPKDYDQLEATRKWWDELVAIKASSFNKELAEDFEDFGLAVAGFHVSEPEVQYITDFMVPKKEDRESQAPLIEKLAKVLEA
ncbi:unnamed protein product [Cyclocybe aegerita]|uniref:MYND-type domain-containing protein n=1 Tax=Cyclocybe aegerita TaxID=1973307 RepID=A0A8S0X3P7_CYCAE|nr:unnamed protein product [Cyclocybe aegerita]